MTSITEGGDICVKDLARRNRTDFEADEVRKVQGSGCETKNATDLEIPKDAFHIVDLQDLHLGEKTNLQFASKKQLLRYSGTFFLYDTFKSSSKKLYKLYTIRVDVKSTSEETNVLPVQYALLINKMVCPVPWYQR